MMTAEIDQAVEHLSATTREDNPKKRKLEDESGPNSTTMNDQPSLPEASLPQFKLTSAKASGQDARSPNEKDSRSSDWETVDRRAKKRQKKTPKVESGNYPTIKFSSTSCRLNGQIKINELQGLVLYLLADGQAPQFVSVAHRPNIKKVVVLMVPGLEMSMFKKSGEEQTSHDGHDRSYISPDQYYPIRLADQILPEELQQFSEMFEHIWPVRTPSDDKYLKLHSPLHAMLTAPAPKTAEEKKWQKNRKGVQPAKEPQGWKNTRVPIPEFIHSAEELLENDYTLHPALHSNGQDRDDYVAHRKTKCTSTDYGWVDTSVTNFEDGTPPSEKIESGSITAGREILAMDCEMCMTGPQEFSLTRISIVSWDGTVVLDELVKPDKPITDYVTQFSGITEKMLQPITTTLADIQKKLLEILNPYTILIGHSLNSDLNALKLTHPYIIDTAIIYPHPRGKPLKSSLKWLAQKYLSREIQKGHGMTGPAAGHDSIEDAKTCLDLVKQKCEKGKEWGTGDAQGENIFKRVARTGVSYKNQGVSAIPSAKIGKSSAAIDWGDPKRGPGSASNYPIGCKNDEEVMEGVIRAVNGDPDGREIPGGGVDFIWARFRELEALKGWWNDNKQVAANAVAKEAAQKEAALKGNNPFSLASKTDAVDNPFKPQNDLTIADEKQLQVAETAPEVAGVAVVESISVPTNALPPPKDLGPKTEKQATADLTRRIFNIYSELPPCTAIVIYSGSGDPREMSKLQTMQATFKREYKIKKWDQLSVKWTDVEEQALRKAHVIAKSGIGFVGVK